MPDHADRFVSKTFDGFTKGLVDRFASALPKGWRMRNGYEIVFPSEREIEIFLGDVIPPAPGALLPRVARLRAGRFLSDTVGGWDLPVTVPVGDPTDATAYAALAWWRERYLRPGRADVDFVMLNRLAELLVRSVPKLRPKTRLVMEALRGHPQECLVTYMPDAEALSLELISHLLTCVFHADARDTVLRCAEVPVL